MSRITVACVLKLGGDFNRDWVYALKSQLSRHLSDFDFVCLTDDCGLKPPIWRVPLVHGWPGWWSKCELWRPGLFTGPVVYFDLDTLIVGDLHDIASYRGKFAMLNDLYTGRKQVASGVMAWTPGPHTEAIYHAAVKLSGKFPKGRSDKWYAQVAPEPDRLQELYPGQIESLKRGAKNGPPKGCRVVCGHGRPRFNTKAAGWAHRVWMESQTIRRAA